MTDTAQLVLPHTWRTLGSDDEIFDFWLALSHEDPCQAETSFAPAGSNFPPPTLPYDRLLKGVMEIESFGEPLSPKGHAYISRMLVLPEEEQEAIREHIQYLQCRGEELELFKVDADLYRDQDRLYDFKASLVRMRIGRVLPHNLKIYLDKANHPYPLRALACALAPFVTEPGTGFDLSRWPCGRFVFDESQDRLDQWEGELESTLRALLENETASLMDVINRLCEGAYGVHQSLISHVKWVKLEGGLEATNKPPVIEMSALPERHTGAEVIPDSVLTPWKESESTGKTINWENISIVVLKDLKRVEVTIGRARKLETCVSMGCSTKKGDETKAWKVLTAFGVRDGFLPLESVGKSKRKAVKKQITLLNSCLKNHFHASKSPIYYDRGSPGSETAGWRTRFTCTLEA